MNIYDAMKQSQAMGEQRNIVNPLKISATKKATSSVAWLVHVQLLFAAVFVGIYYYQYGWTLPTTPVQSVILTDAQSSRQQQVIGLSAVKKSVLLGAYQLNLGRTHHSSPAKKLWSVLLSPYINASDQKSIPLRLANSRHASILITNAKGLAIGSGPYATYDLAKLASKSFSDSGNAAQIVELDSKYSEIISTEPVKKQTHSIKAKSAVVYQPKRLQQSSSHSVIYRPKTIPTSSNTFIYNQAVQPASSRSSDKNTSRPQAKIYVPRKAALIKMASSPSKQNLAKRQSAYRSKAVSSQESSALLKQTAKQQAQKLANKLARQSKKSINQLSKRSAQSVTDAAVAVPQAAVATMARKENIQSEHAVAVKSGKELEIITSAQDLYSKLLAIEQTEDSTGLRQLLLEQGEENFNEVLQIVSRQEDQSSWLSIGKVCAIVDKFRVKSAKRALLCSEYYIDDEDYSGALRLFRHRLNLSANTEYYAKKAYILLQLQRYSESAELYKRLVNIDNRQSVWWLGLGYALSKNKQQYQAHNAYAEAYRYAQPDAEYVPFLEQMLKTDD